MSQLNGWKTACAVCVLCAATAIALRAQTYTVLHSFDYTDGEFPFAALLQATDGDLFGTTAYGGANGTCLYGCGTFFEISPNGTLTTLYSFCSKSGCSDGEYPNTALIQANDGYLYGTTIGGGVGFNNGTVFRITPSGGLTTLYSFCSLAGGCADGSEPTGLTLASDGNFYGTTFNGGTDGWGTVFKITPDGTLTTLHNFDYSVDGGNPGAGLVQATSGNFYGTTLAGGANDYGTIFKITPAGALTTLYSFCSQNGCSDGSNPTAGLAQGLDGNLYGTTQYGGVDSGGTLFKITLAGTLTTLYTFCSQTGCTDGQYPSAALVQATDGNFYGSTQNGGANNGGVIFKITPSGTLTQLYSFCSQSGCTDGANPHAGLALDTNGNLYGAAEFGGTSGACTGGCGTIFSLSVSLRPFVETQPTSGTVGSPVEILGNSLKGATSVTFNGTAATFTVVSSSLITTTVPAGATSGEVHVTTAHGTIRSNVPFRVVQ